MSAGLRSVCSPVTRCKCCGGEAFAYGVVDFHKNCENRRHFSLGMSGVPIYYHRCVHCQFIFSTAFDEFTTEDFLRDVYNDAYSVVDPDHHDVRPRKNAETVSRLFPGTRPGRLLDYGGGNGLLTSLLRQAGFPQVETYDPFVPEFSMRPEGQFDCIVSFEVLEHATNPAHLIADWSGLLQDPGLIIFSTLLQPFDIDYQGLNWWYAGPRNGHVSLYSRPSLETLLHRWGLNFGSFDEGMHLAFRQVPDFATHLFDF
ncbi:MAG: class I SAM-dependent methyltransferase [Isosphaeraceae bacterium]